jgi:hypothetical protein
MTFSIMTLSIVALSVLTLNIGSYYAEHCNAFVILMLSVAKLSETITNVSMLSVVTLIVGAPH